jgi:hypothetical protein
MTPDWQPLRAELRLWRAGGLDLPIWWRDDDAVRPTPALERLAALSEALSLQVHLAIIPAQAEAALSTYVAEQDHLIPLVHGWAHRNHSPATEKKAEFGQVRETAPQEMSKALHRMQNLFADKVLPVFVPPWNRIHPACLAPLAQAGYRALSTFGARAAPEACPGLLQINTHLDPIDWKGTRGLIDPDLLIQRLVALLAARRRQEADRVEPLGYLTHHLVHDEAIWTFSRTLIDELTAGGARPQSLKLYLEQEP